MWRRLAAVAVTGLVLYGLAPALGEVLGAWDDLDSISPGWWAGVLGFELAAMAATIAVQRVALNTRRWWPVATSNLTSSALSKVVPGGSATAAAAQAAMLTRAGFSGPAVATGLTAGGVLLLTSVAGLPLLCVPALLAGRVPGKLADVALLALALFVVLFALSVVLLTVDPVVRAAGRATTWVLSKVRRSTPPPADLPERLLAQRDLVRRSLGHRWWEALGAAVGHWLLDFLCLLAALEAVGARPRLSLALLAYVAAQLLSQIPVTPGGLGVVEAGLTGMLALAGVGAAAAAVATLAYRLASYWLPLPLGLAAWLVHRHRYGAAAAREDAAPGAATA